MSTFALSAQHLFKHYGTGENPVPVLNDLCLTIAPGRFEAVMGPSGSGKSTLLHLLAGLITPDQGSIEIDGTEITKLNDHDVTCCRRRKIGLVFQDFNLIPALSVEENIVLPLLLVIAAITVAKAPVVAVISGLISAWIVYRIN